MDCLGIAAAHVNVFLKSVARRLHLDPYRLVPKSVRVRGPTQLSAFLDAVTMQQGNWRSVVGLLAYARGSLAHAKLIASAMHDPEVLSLELLQLSYSLPSVATPHHSPVL